MGLVLGYAADRWWGDPRRFHPVAGFGLLASTLERRTYAARRPAGVAHVGLLVGGAIGGGLILQRCIRSSAALTTLTTAALTWAVLGGRSLVREAETLTAQLDAGDVAAARSRLTHLVGRDTSRLDPPEMARACVESLAENTSDAVVASLLWGAVAGLPGLVGHRAVNTLDAMVGHRSPRYEHFGWAAARLDDWVNWVPARVCAALAAAAAPLVGGQPRDALDAVRRDAHRHPSPNGGVAEAAFAGALGVRLGGVNVYDGGPEDRGTLGTGRSPAVADIARASRLASAVGAGALAVAVAVALAAGGGRRPVRGPT